MLCAHGVDCAPSAAKPVGNSLGGAVGGGQYSVSAHGSKQGGSTVDAVQLGLPPALWQPPSKAADDDAGGGGKGGKEQQGQSGGSGLMGKAAASLADGLLAYVSTNCGLQKVPGSGALRRSGGLKRDLWKRHVTDASVRGVQADGTLLVD